MELMRTDWKQIAIRSRHFYAVGNLKVIILFTICTLCYPFQPAFGQKGFEDFNKSISLSTGMFHISRRPNLPYILSYYYENNGPMVTGGIELNKTDVSNHYLYARYGFLKSRQDTVFINGAAPTSFEKYYRLKGNIQLFSLGYSWHRYFGKNLRLQPYTCLGGEILVQSREIQSGAYVSSSTIAVIPYLNPSYTVFSANLQLGVGIRHKLTDRLTLFEQVEAGTLLFFTSGYGMTFAPTHTPQELLLNFNIGLSFELK